MALRTLESPGVEIHEIDKSQYSPAMTGTKCYVMGYSDKGECYQPMQFTSKAAWQNYYGDPDNEAERYFYNACSEVLNQNGVLYSARLPYENKAKDKMVGYKFKVSTYSDLNPTAGEYLQKYPVKHWVDHDSDFEQAALKWTFDNKCLREIDGNLVNGLEKDEELTQFYNCAIDQFNKTYNRLNSFQRCSIDYYRVNNEKSQELSGRFISKEKAEEYLDTFFGIKRQGNYCYQVGKVWNKEYKRWEFPEFDYENMSSDNYCLKYDDGDWLAQPLYCEYWKEATVSSFEGSFDYVSAYTSLDVANISNLTAQIAELSGNIPTEYKNMETWQDVKDNIASLSACEEISAQRAAWDFNMCIQDFEQFQSDPKEGKEIRKYGYVQGRWNWLRGRTTKIEALDLYGKHGSEEWCFKVPEFFEVHAWNDGCNNEYLMATPVSGLYYDEIMDMESQKTPSAKPISSLYEHELWKDYQSRPLSDIIRLSQTADGLPVDTWKNRITSWTQMLSVFKDEAGIKFEQLFNNIENTSPLSAYNNVNLDGSFGVYQHRVHDDVPYYRLADLDPNLHDYLTITQSQQPITCDLTAVDEYRTDESKVASNTFWVFDRTGATLNKIPEDERKGKDRECIGIFPVITTVANALYAQSLITPSEDEILDYETLSGLITKSKKYDDEGNNTAELSDCNRIRVSDCSMKLSQCDRTKDDSSAIDTVSREANGYFLPIQMNPQGTGIDTENSKKIGVVVYKAYLDASEGNKISFSPVESFCGSLDKDAKNPNTGVSTFLDKIINTQSEYIYFFSNCFASTATRKEYNEVADFFVCKTGDSGMLGWFSDETLETISLPTQYQSIDKCFRNVENINDRDIDIIVDAGLANIAQYMKSIYGGTGAHYYDLAVVDEGGNSLLKNWTCKSASDVNAWKTTIFKYDNFCKNVRKDCMFIADGPRPLVLTGEKKVVRSSKPSNTIDANILPYVKYCTGLNTNYGAGYLDWFQITDEFTGDEFWCPPSIKAMGVYINTDLNFNYWDAPAGLNRGVVQALDVAFSPTNKQSGPIYQKNWNYAINYPNDGIVLEGQKTFQVKPSALDRVNVRRLMLRLERQVGKVLRYVVYEGNTAYMRQRVVDLIDPYFSQSKIGGGLYDYKIICDESNNTPSTIDNNELHITIGVKPTKTIEFIMCSFVLLSTGASWSEM